MTSYYGRPVIKRPVWKATDIAGYLFLGGLAGASSSLAAGADLTGRPALARPAKLGATGALGLAVAALVHDLGRPERFHHMLRVAKPTSPMNMGSWLLVAYGPVATATALSNVTGLLPRLGRASGLAAGALGPCVAAYTAALITDTAVPAWHEGHREMPFLFTGSAATAAAGLALAAAPPTQTSPARHLAVAGVGAELAAFALMKRRLGPLAAPYRTGTAGRLARAAGLLGVAGAATAGLARDRVASIAAGSALLAASAATRFAVFHAGLASADDPKYTVEPQRERLARRPGP